VDQKAVTKADLKPHLKLVRRRIAKNRNSPAWKALETRWEALAEKARGTVAAFLRGRPGLRFEFLAASEVVKLAENVSPRQVLEVTAAMVLMWEMEPRRFKSDNAMWTQLARRVRGLSDMSYGRRYVHATGKVKRCYRDLSPRASITLGRWLAEALGIAGVHIARVERELAAKKAKEREALHAALANLT
jgi:hypothetical protein